MEGGKFKFVAIKRKVCPALEDKKNLEFLMKWSMKGHLKVKYYNFNEAFHIYEKQAFVDSFFTDPAVVLTLETLFGEKWVPLGVQAARVECEHIPCTVTSMEFFSTLYESKNKIVSHGSIRQCMEDNIGGFYLSNHLHQMLLNEEHETYNLYTKSERDQFIFHLFKHLCLGGKWCQYDDSIDAYLDVTKNLYKSLLSVERYEKQNELFIRSMVFKCKAYREDDMPLCPKDPDHPQSFIYLIVDPFKRQVAALSHEYCDIFIS